MIGSCSIFFRQLTTNLVITIILIVILHVPLLYINYTDQPTREQSFRQTQAIADQLAVEFKSGKIPDMQVWRFLSRATNSILWLTNQEGVAIGGIPPARWLENNKAVTFSSQDELSSAVKNVNQNIYVMRVPLTLNDQRVYLWAQYNYQSLYTYAWEKYKKFYFLPVLVGIIAAVIIGIILSRKLTYGIANIAKAAAGFSRGNYDSRTSITDNTELGMLGKTFNTMADSIVHTQQTRREFYANVSHELKTPIACIQAMSEALLDGIAQNPREYKQYLQKIHIETQRMSRLVYDLLDIEKIESGKMEFRLEKVDLATLLNNQMIKMKEMLKEKKLFIDLSIETENIHMLADKDRLVQILDNLLSNAIRHSPISASIRITLGEVDNRLFLCVADQGKGIAEDEISLIWERFYRGDKSRNHTSGNSGLGLAITRSLVEAMNGTIEVQSKVGIGTQFMVTFPVLEEL